MLQAREFAISKCSNLDEKSSQLYEEIKRSSNLPEESKKSTYTKAEKEKEQVAEDSQTLTIMQESLSKRLQSENPFDEFREAVERISQ